MPSVSIPHMGCMPYGLNRLAPQVGAEVFQSLIWVACPTGQYQLDATRRDALVSIPHMGCMPYGLSADTLGSKNDGVVSIPHMGCMPYGL